MRYTKEQIEKFQARWRTPKGKSLIKKIKQTRCYLSPVLFRKVVQNFSYINDEEVQDGIDLRGINLIGFDFRVPIKEDDSGFEEEMAILSFIHFEGAILRHATFQDGKIHNCFFENTDLSHTNFKNASINTCSFHDADMTGTLLSGANVINCNFTETHLHDVNLTTIVVDQSTVFDKKLKEEKDKNYHIASVQYKQLSQMCKNSSLFKLGDHYHYREMVCRRRQMKWYNPLRFFSFFFGDLSCKYGTSIIRILIWMLVTIFGFAAYHYFAQDLAYYSEPINTSLEQCVYFSITTFSTVGYGDFHPVGGALALSATEGVLGIILTSLFTVIIARKIIRD